MIAIVGLGNPGEKYTYTRHNVGFWAIDFIRSEIRFPDLRFDKKFQAEISKDTHNLHQILLAKPTTYMNNSGEAVVSILNFFKIQPSDIIVIHDDLDISFGEFKIQKGKGPRAHNGISSIERTIGLDFTRIRIGVENRGELKKVIAGRDYVLSDFSKQEEEALNSAILPKIIESIFDHYIHSD